MYYIVLMREDSYGPIAQMKFKYYDEAKAYFDKQCEYYFFCKLCQVLEENDHV